MSRLKLGVISALAVLGIAGGVFAGVRSYIPLTVNVAGHFANGGLAETHNTADFTQYAECGSNPTTGFCTVRDSGGTIYSCFTTDASLLSVIRSMSPDSLFSIVWDPTTNQCTYVLSYASSRVAPRTP
jgi:hypothetical protein